MLVPASSMKVVGGVENWSVSFEAIHWKRTDSRSVFFRRPAFTTCQRSTESAVDHPTHEPVAPWSPTFHQVARRSLELGIAGAAARRPASSACSRRQSRSVFSEGTTLRIRFMRLALGLAFATTYLLRGRGSKGREPSPCVWGRQPHPLGAAGSVEVRSRGRTRST